MRKRLISVAVVGEVKNLQRQSRNIPDHSARISAGTCCSVDHWAEQTVFSVKEGDEMVEEMAEEEAVGAFWGIVTSIIGFLLCLTFRGVAAALDGEDFDRAFLAGGE